MNSLINAFMHWVSVHPQLTGLFVGIIAFSESLAFVGLLVPGAALMLAAGALVGAGLVDFWSIFTWAVGGAILGDGISFWLGHHYRDHLRDFKIVQRHPQWLSHATTFFHRHGGKSIFLARFVGPVRPVLPVVAGMLRMSPLRFVINNVLSALLWAPAHLLAGMLVGASLVLAGQITARLAIVLGILALTIWLIIWLVHRSYLKLQPRLGGWIALALQWSRTHPRLAWLFTDLYDPTRPPARALFIWLILLIASMWLFLGVLEDVLSRDPLVYAGQAIYQYLQQLRTPLGDAVMIVITELGDAAVTLPLAITVILWLLWQRAWRDTLYWLGALGFGMLAVNIIKFMSQLPRPVSPYPGIELSQFPSGHATMSTIIYGLLAVFIAMSVQPRWRWPVYAVATLVIIVIAFSRLYLGAHWLPDVTAGLALGGSGIAVLAMAYSRHHTARISGYGLPVITILVFFVAASSHIYRQFDHDRERYAVHHEITTLSFAQWQSQAWQNLSTWRLDLRGERKQALNLQWAGELPTIRRQLLAQGWHIPLLLNAHTALSWLLPKPSLAQLPVLPQLHDGQYESLVLVHADTQAAYPNEQLILRLWPTSLRLQPHTTPVWLGTVTTQRLQHLPLISFLYLTDHYQTALTQLEASLPAVSTWRTQQRVLHTNNKHTRWDGTVLLIDSRH